MRRILKLFFLGAVVLLGSVLLASAVAGLLARYPAEGEVASSQRPLLGAYHIHSTASDGRAPVSEIAMAAARAGLSFLIVTDHNLREVPPPRFEHGVLLVFGTEVSTPVGHLVMLGTSRGLLGGEFKDPVGAAKRLGAFTFLAHPVQPRMPWTDWERAEGATGLELYSADTMLREAQRHPFTRLLPAVGAYSTHPVHGLFALIAPQPDATLRLLSLSVLEAKVPLCSVDAHGWPPYEVVFRMLAMSLPKHILELPKEAAEASQQVLTALTRGEAHCLFRPMGSDAAFEILGLGPSRQARVGQQLEILLPESVFPDVEVRVTGPARTSDGGRRVQLLGAGPIQLEIWRKAPGQFWGSTHKPWIIPGVITVRPEQSR